MCRITLKMCTPSSMIHHILAQCQQAGLQCNKLRHKTYRRICNIGLGNFKLIYIPFKFLYLNKYSGSICGSKEAALGLGMDTTNHVGFTTLFYAYWYWTKFFCTDRQVPIFVLFSHWSRWFLSYQRDELLRFEDRRSSKWPPCVPSFIQVTPMRSKLTERQRLLRYHFTL